MDIAVAVRSLSRQEALDRVATESSLEERPAPRALVFWQQPLTNAESSWGVHALVYAECSPVILSRFVHAKRWYIERASSRALRRGIQEHSYKPVGAYLQLCVRKWHIVVPATVVSYWWP